MRRRERPEPPIKFNKFEIVLARVIMACFVACLFAVTVLLLRAAL
jgi:hypothetical protein